MYFENLGWAGYVGMVLVCFFVVAGCAGVNQVYKDYKNYLERGGEKYLDYMNINKGGALSCFVIAVLILFAVLVGNSWHQEDIASDARQAQEQAKADAKAQEEREATKDIIRGDLEIQGLPIMGVYFDQNRNSFWVEISGPYEGCTYKAYAAKSPEDNFVLNLDTAQHFTNDPILFFPPGGGNAYTPDCPDPSLIFTQEGGK